MNLIKNYFKLGFILALLLFCGNFSLEAHGMGKHKEQIGYVLFGYANAATAYSNTNQCTMQAYNLIGEAVAAAIDYKGSEISGYSELKRTYQNCISRSGVINFPSLDKELKIEHVSFAGHREYCHQGFDYTYSESDNYPNEKNARWSFGRKLLIDATRYAFTYGNEIPNNSTSEFIAMIAYYVHLLGDLEEDSTKTMKGTNNLGTFKGFLTELANKISVYGNKLGNKAVVSNLVYELRKLIPSMPTVTYQKAKTDVEKAYRKQYSDKIFDILVQYVPLIIKNNVNSIFKFNTNQSDFQNVA